MKIDAFNKDIINTSTIYIHDSVFINMTYNYFEKKIDFKSQNDQNITKIYHLEFFNVIGYEMISCEFWGKSPYIFDWEVKKKEDQALIAKLVKEQNDHHYPYSCFSNDTKYFESVITFTSGNKLTIACEYIYFSEIVS